MTEHEKLSLALLADMTAGIAILVGHATGQLHEDEGGAMIKGYLHKVTEVLEKVDEAFNAQSAHLGDDLGPTSQPSTSS
jgi:hypothetical protein